MRHPSCVVREFSVDAEVVPGRSVRVPVVMRYDASDPFAVRATFRFTPDDEVTWVFARELLAVGLSTATGEGDVRVWPSWAAGEEVLRIALVSPDGEARVQAPSTEFIAFLTATYRVCPWGQESLSPSLDSALEELLTS